MAIVNLIAFILVAAGALNWGLIGICNYNLVEKLTMKNKIATKIVYIAVMAAMIWLIISAIISSGSIVLM